MAGLTRTAPVLGSSSPRHAYGRRTLAVAGAASTPARWRVCRTVLATEGGTAAAIVVVLLLPLVPALIALPLLGVMLNGTSSVLYGTVPELAPPDRTDRAFAVFYTGTIGSGALAPVLFGILGDAAGVNWATTATAVAAMITMPLALALAPRLPRGDEYA